MRRRPCLVKASGPTVGNGPDPMGCTEQPQAACEGWVLSGPPSWRLFLPSGCRTCWARCWTRWITCTTWTSSTGERVARPLPGVVPPRAASAGEGGGRPTGRRGSQTRAGPAPPGAPPRLKRECHPLHDPPQAHLGWEVLKCKERSRQQHPRPLGMPRLSCCPWASQKQCSCMP